ncbi:MAG TPA: hypothetical protein P5534_20120 [Candidatus Paceibacterota bacterium]|nr:hypothetical protein [Candidatus Paceibacterota bacterium]HRZ55701.1 hypothetical protein [Candidatus Paceibacterota bacterium]
MSENSLSPPQGSPRSPLWLALLLSAMAGGMGWGIRGQYGHETGAMIAGLLVSLVLVRFFCRAGTSLAAARAVAFATIAVSFGGSMTYGQTVGLTQDAPLIGNWAALRWGLLGLFIKGGIWIGFVGAFLGMALGRETYRPRDWAGLLGGMLVLYLAGMWLLNEPFDPARRVLPRLYFSADWRWQPAADLEPRRERWGGLLFSLIGLLLYVRHVRGDRLAWRLALWGMLGGGLGFSLGQGIQAFHAWNASLFEDGWRGAIDPLINWWNVMEIVFGAIWGAVLAAGLALNRGLVFLARKEVSASLSPWLEGALLCIHVALVLSWQFLATTPLEGLLDIAIPTAIIPILAIAAGRYWPYLVSLPLVTLPIAAKTLMQLTLRSQDLSSVAGWVFCLGIPLTLTGAAALWFARRAESPDGAQAFTRYTLLGMTWLLFSLNFAMFRFPWPWTEWTSRTPSALAFAICAVGLSLGGISRSLSLKLWRAQGV